LRPWHLCAKLFSLDKLHRETQVTIIMRTRHFSLGLCLFLLVSVKALAAEPANWPRFRGPNGSGVSTDKNVPVKWSDKEGILWKAELPGAGNGSPIVWGDRIFIQSATEKQRLLLCLSADKGEIVWQQAVPGKFTKKHTKNSFASSTPATDGERVYAAFWDGDNLWLAAYSFKGDPLWSNDLGEYVSQHGVGQSPIVVEDKVILVNDNDKTAAVLAFDAKSGKPAWRADRKAFRACYSTPVLHEKEKGVTELIVASTAGIAGYNPKDGSEFWHWTWEFGSTSPLRTVSSPILTDGGLVLSGGGEGPTGPRETVAVKLGGSGDVTKTHLAWDQKADFPYVGCLLVSGDHLYFVNDSGFAHCRSAKTGEKIWSERLGGNVSASPLLIDGKVYAVDEKGNAFVFAAAGEYKLLAKNSLGEPVMATPAVADGKLYLRGDKHLYCIGKTK
jgi:outer membrane protein assembly factor BamB